ncbi:glycosyltransferase family 4 protein [bacterium]|nr:glycosyltransferase family 4 protein [bacterium]
MLYLALESGEGYGWGVAGSYLIKELSKLTEVGLINQNTIKDFKTPSLPHDIFHGTRNETLLPQYPIQGKRNFGYTFFEVSLPPEAKKNSCFYDIIFAGSSWCKEKSIEHGIASTKTLIQGVDPELFFPIEEEKQNYKDNFVIFSGGKFEFRKGQDLVIKAFKILQNKYKDLFLVCAWYNFWDFSLKTMKMSSLITVDLSSHDFIENIKNTLSLNKIDLRRVKILPFTKSDKFREIFRDTDIGIFPNRCEGGTNLVLMEYMACGKPCIASYNSGHKDIVNKQNALLLEKMIPLKIYQKETNYLLLNWFNLSLEELVEKIEYAYHNRDKLKEVGNKAGKDLRSFSWETTAKTLLSYIQ